MPADYTSRNDEVRRLWNANAEWWDDKIGDGTDFQEKLIESPSERLLGISPGDVILDIGCGAGRFARRMAGLGARVVAFDFCERFIERAKQRTPSEMTRLEFHYVDATDTGQVVALGRNRFDKAVATMSLMDMAAIEPLFAALRECLKPGGGFVFSVIHPCFNSASATRFREDVIVDGRVSTQGGVRVTEYLTGGASKGEGIIGQPETQLYFHRSISELLNVGFKAGFAVDGLEEPRFDVAGAEGKGVGWADLPDIPPVLVVRMRLRETG